MGAIYFLASQAFGFAVGGYLVGRLIGPEEENTEEEEFRAGAHGFVMWALAVVAGVLLIAAASGVTGSSMVSAIAPRPIDQATDTAYWVDMMFGPGPNTPQVMAAKGEAWRILAMNAPGRSATWTPNASAVPCRAKRASRCRQPPAASQMQRRAGPAPRMIRETASITALWTAIALLFGMIVAVAAAISARWQDDKINFGWKPRR